MRSLLTALVAAAVSLAAGAVSAQTPATSGQYPNRPIRVIVPFAAGGTGDVVGRMMSEKLSRVSGQQFVVENRAGASGVIGVEALLRSPRDGYTLMMTTHSPVLITPHLRTVNYNPDTDLIAVALLAENVSAMAVHPSVPVKTFKEFVAYAKANPGKVNYASAGAGSIQHLRNEMLNRTAGLGMEHIPYKSAGEAMNDVLAGQIQMVFESVVFNYARTNQLRILAVNDEQRHPDFPDTPTIAEELPGFRFPSWTAAFFAAGTPQEAVVRVNALVNEVLKDKATIDQMWQGGYRSLTYSPEETRKLYERDSAFFKKVIADIGLPKE